MGKRKSGIYGKWGGDNVTYRRKAGGSDVNNRGRLGNPEVVGPSFLTVVSQSVWGWLKE